MSDADSAAPASKPPSPFQKKVRRTARQKAEAAGLDWKSMSKEDRQKMRQQARQTLKAERLEKRAKKAKAEA